jgi:hypothetical protein
VGLQPNEVRDFLLNVWRGHDPVSGQFVSLEERYRALEMLIDPDFRRRVSGTSPPSV